jgi:hypothetical protein
VSLPGEDGGRRLLGSVYATPTKRFEDVWSERARIGESLMMLGVYHLWGLRPRSGAAARLSASVLLRMQPRAHIPRDWAARGAALQSQSRREGLTPPRRRAPPTAAPSLAQPSPSC